MVWIVTHVLVEVLIHVMDTVRAMTELMGMVHVHANQVMQEILVNIVILEHVIITELLKIMVRVFVVQEMQGILVNILERLHVEATVMLRMTEHVYAIQVQTAKILIGTILVDTVHVECVRMVG